MLNEIQTKDVIERLKEHYKLPSDMELANFLGVSRPTISAWKARNTLDWNLMFSKCEGINLEYVIYGKEVVNTYETQNVNFAVSKIYAPENQLTESVSQNSEIAPAGNEKITELQMRIVELEAENRVLEATMDKLIAAKSRSNAQSVVDYPDLLNRQPRLRAAEPVTRFSGGKRDDTE